MPSNTVNSTKSPSGSSTAYTSKDAFQSFGLLIIIAITALVICIAGCKLNGESGNGAPVSHSILTGAGSTFANPIYTKMIDEYRAKTGIETTYQSICSTGGLKKIMSKEVDFGASDAFLTNDDMSMFTSPVVEFPTCLGAVVITYNLPGIPELKLTPDLIARIYSGKITNWNDPKIKAENRDAKLPDLAITVVHRSDGSGTTFVFTDYLSKVDNEWKTKIGAAKLPNWPVGVGGDGNEGVAGAVKLTPGAIGYNELTYALQKNMEFALIKNASGKFIKASLESTSLAANVDIPADTRISITNSSVEGAYPISSFTWIILYKEQSYSGRGAQQAEDLVKELDWMIHPDGQQFTISLFYAPLPPKAIDAAENVLKSVTYEGKPILQ